MANKIRGKEGTEAVLTFRLPRSLHEKLKGAAGGRSVSEEMRERLEASFAELEAAPDEPTRQLLAAVAAMADALGRLEGLWREESGWLARLPKRVPTARAMGSMKWHESPYGFAVFRRAVNYLLDACEPGGEHPAERMSTDNDATALAALGATKMDRNVIARLIFWARLEEWQADLGEQDAKRDKP